MEITALQSVQFKFSLLMTSWNWKWVCKITSASADRREQCNQLRSKSLKGEKKWNCKSAARADPELLASQIANPLSALSLSALWNIWWPLSLEMELWEFEKLRAALRPRLFFLLNWNRVYRSGFMLKHGSCALQTISFVGSLHKFTEGHYKPHVAKP